MTRQRQVSETLAALAFPVLGSMGLSVLGLQVVRLLAPDGVFVDSNDVVGNYLQTLGSIYAVLLAFVMFVVWTQFNDARSHVERESNELMDLFRTVRGVPESTRACVQELAQSYVRAVLEREWPTMASDGPLDPSGGVILDRMWQAVQSAEPSAGAEQSVYREVLKRLDDVSDARSNRLSSSRNKIPSALRLLMYVGAVSLVVSMYLFDLRSIVVHGAITAALAGAVSHIIFVIEDLDSCYSGHWQVPRAPFERVLAQMQAPAPTPAPGASA